MPTLSTGAKRSTSPKVLVVEDDRDSREMLCTWLEEHGYRTVAASEGEEALRKMNETPELSLILLDLMMPGMNGWQFRTSQRGNRQLRHVPIAVMTAHPNPVGEAEWLDPEAILAKPLDLEAVLQIVRRCCGPAVAAPEAARPPQVNTFR
jgi:CheY-like chemotaxis protein